MKKAGRKNTIDKEVERLHAALRIPQMRHLPLVEEAMGRQTLALLRQLEAACVSADDLAEASVQAFAMHADAEIITGFPGLGPLSGARVLAEIGDDRSRFADARGPKAYAGAAPVTRASGKSVSVVARGSKPSDWPASAICGPSSRWLTRTEHEPTTTADVKPEIATQPPRETFSTE